jgi:nitrite reductase (NO-forming)
MTRARWHLVTSGVVLAWLIAAVVAGAAYRSLPAQPWLIIHLLLLGAATNAILIWSSHFSAALLRLPGKPGRKPEIVRLVVLNLSIIAVFASVLAAKQTLLVVPAAVIFAVVLWHLVDQLARMRRALPSRFGATLRYYVLAGIWLLVGVSIASWMSLGSHNPEGYGRLVVAHACVNLLGWIGFTVTGTLVTLWPTMLRTQVAKGAERSAHTALPILTVGLSVTTIGALADQRGGVVVGIAAYLAGLVVVSRPMLTEARHRLPNSFATWSALVGWLWLLISLTALLAIVTFSSDWAMVADRSGVLVGLLSAGFVAQILLGAMSYLLPVVVGGGPTAVRWRNSVVDRGAIARVVATNTALIVWVLPTPAAVHLVTSMVVLLGLASAIPLLIRASTKPPTEHQRGSTGSTAKPDTTARTPVVPRSRSGAAAVGVAVVLLAVAGAVSVEPTSLVVPASAGSSEQAGVVRTGQTTTIQVDMVGMRFEPSELNVPVGNDLVINVTNKDADPHDLKLETGQRTPLLNEGQSARLDVGTIGQSLDGWCSVPGHRQMGMTLQIVATGASADQAPMATDGGVADHMDHSGSEATGESAAKDLDLMGQPGPDFQARDANLPPAGRKRVHRVTLEVQQNVQEVAPGVTQTRWTFGRTAPGPTLHGKIGDTFKITLINNGDIGHSIDFHAGALAPDRPMRTIAPGEQLQYNFTATRAGIWLYHCSTMPMSLHIANGMFGAVVIDPPDLAPVDKQFVMVQSEFYLGPQGGTADMASIKSDQPDLVVFNGYPNQYKYRPLAVNAGDRVRIWVIAAGPNRGTAFHVVGGQFDTVYQEGRYILRPEEGGGSQVLGLATAQGGFVELTLPQPGHYPFVSHSMVDAERGAIGILHASK